jgi:hypothetical protein
LFIYTCIAFCIFFFFFSLSKLHIIITHCTIFNLCNSFMLLKKSLVWKTINSFLEFYLLDKNKRWINSQMKNNYTNKIYYLFKLVKYVFTKLT